LIITEAKSSFLFVQRNLFIRGSEIL